MYLELWKEDPFLIVLSYLLSSILVSTLLYLPTLELKILGLLESLQKYDKQSSYSSIDNENLVSKFKIRQDTQPMDDESSFNSASSSHTSSSSICVEKKMEEPFVQEEVAHTLEVNIDEKQEPNLKEAVGYDTAGSDEDRNRSEIKDSQLEFTENVSTDEIFQDTNTCAEKDDDEMNIDACTIDNESTSSTEKASYSKSDDHHESSDISDEEDAQYEEILLPPIPEEEDIDVCQSTEETETSPSKHAEHQCEDSQDMVTLQASSTESSVEYLSSFDEYKLTKIDAERDTEPLESLKNSSTDTSLEQLSSCTENDTMQIIEEQAEAKDKMTEEQQSVMPSNEETPIDKIEINTTAKEQDDQNDTLIEDEQIFEPSDSCSTIVEKIEVDEKPQIEAEEKEEKSVRGNEDVPCIDETNSEIDTKSLTAIENETEEDNIEEQQQQDSLKEESVCAVTTQNTQEPNSTPFPSRGIRLSYLLNEFVEECGGREALTLLTTKEVCDSFVKPSTKQQQCSYCDLISEKSSSTEMDAIGDAAVFISHAWKYKFLDVIDALENHFKYEPDKMIWMDLFSYNQHTFPSCSKEWFATTLKDAIGQFGHTVMVMAPGKNIYPYERTWCAYEAYCASEAGAKFEIAMSQEEHTTFMDQCKKNPSNILTTFFDKITAESSRTSKVEDRVRIHAVIQESIGFPQVNSALMTQHRGCLINTLQHELFFISGENTIEEANFIFLLATLHQRQGNYDEARPLYEECLQKRKVLLGNNHQDTLVSMNDLGLLYYQQGDYENAAPLYQDYFQKCRSKLGKSHPNTLISMSNLALLYKQQGKCEEAQKLYEDCLQRKKSKLGSDHPSTLVSMNNLALVYKEQGSYDDARRLLEECLEKTKSRLGENHPSTLEATRNLESLQLVQTVNDEDKELNDDPPILETV
ncbi:hypothetical protein CTEN210_03625 [Chaetoceros tenuissimus]|uniref:Kinesin light chain n=1 Tax=Chaetoceros tenuissimus TaxID=426638 RepID=A0AAD3H1Q8_9STRA|nr:hypothetical protein CTEN210_03625 [Chaetoceros tenuissimus]